MTSPRAQHLTRGGVDLDEPGLWRRHLRQSGPWP